MHMSTSSDIQQPGNGRDEAQRAPAHDIAVIGLACRFPQAPDADSFWKLLCEGVNAVTEVPGDRWCIDDYYDPRPGQPGKMNTRWGGFLDQVDRFDASFFRISAREAKSIDPQQRLLLEVAWEALEHAGVPHEQLEDSATGVFVGICASEYGMISGNDRSYRSFDKYFGTGTALSVAAGRISYSLNLHGPALAIETACSSSLVALHQAVGSLRRGECTLALTGGVNVVLSPAVGIYFSQLGAVSNSRECKAFDADADGYVRSEGCGVIVLKRLCDASADGDRVLAVIKGSAVNHDGRSAGLSAPNGKAQEAVLRAALRDAHVDPCLVDYIEAHGTGTRLGDPIEANAIGNVYGVLRRASQPLLLGSVKANLGHLEAAAGIAGVIKTVLAIQRGAIPRQINLRERNPLIAWDDLRLSLPHATTPWPNGRATATAAVSSFGFSGTNAHVILAAHVADAVTPAATAGQSFILPISARSPTALRELAQRCVARLQRISPDDPESLAAVCRGWALRRGHHPYRMCAAGSTAADLARELQERVRPGSQPVIRSDAAPALALVFSGQGSQWTGMAQECLQLEVSAAVLESIDAIVVQTAGWSLLHELQPGASGKLAHDDAQVTQVCIFAMQVALARLWQSLGLQPTAVVGHSMGEIAAAHIAGALSLRQATELSLLRSALLAQVAGRGLMAVAEIPHQQADEALQRWRGRIVVAGYNSPMSTIFSGDAAAIRELLATLQADAIFCRELRTGGVPGHSPMLTGLGAEFAAALTGLAPAEGQLSFISSVDGAAVPGRDLNATYWTRNLLEPVRFADAVHYLAERDYSLFLEIAPKPMLLTAIRQVHAALGKRCSAEGSLHPEHRLQQMQARTLANFYEAGLQPQWQLIYPGQGRWECAPGYPWQRERHWVDELGLQQPTDTGSQPGAVLREDRAAQLAACIEQWDDVGIRSVNMPNLAPWVLLAPDRQAAFYLAVHEASCIAWAYLGAAQDFDRHVRWLAAQCAAHSLQLLLLADDSVAVRLQSLGLQRFPVGAMHRLIDLPAYSLDGPQLRRLRTQVRRYERDSGGAIGEYRPGTDRALDLAIVALIDEWQSLKRAPVPAAQWVKRQIAGGAPLGPGRLFLTQAQGKLHNALLLTSFGNGRGFLLDLEFYGAAAPPGCNEFAIVRIAQLLAAEGCRELSLGGSYGIEAASSDAGPTLGAYQRQLQFKRKFAPQETRLNIYRTTQPDDGESNSLLELLIGAVVRPATAEHRIVASLAEVTPHAALEERRPAELLHPLLRKRLSIAGRSIVFEGHVDARQPLIDQHRVVGRTVMPGAVVIELALAAVRLVAAARSWMLRELVLLQPLQFDDEAGRCLQVLLHPVTDEEFAFEVHSRQQTSPSASWLQHATGKAVAARAAEALPQSDLPAAWQEIAAADFYAGLATAGIVYGPMYRSIEKLSYRATEAQAQILVPDGSGTDAAGFALHPACIDAALQVLAATAGSHGIAAPVVLQSIESIWLRGAVQGRCMVRARSTASETDSAFHTGEVDLLGPDGELLAAFRGVLARQLPAVQTQGASVDRAMHRLEWIDSSLPPLRSTDASGWLLVGTQTPLLQSLQQQLQQSGGKIRCVIGSDRRDASQQLQRLPPSGWAGIDRILLLPAVPADSTCAEYVPDLVRTLAANTHGEPLALWTITRAVQSPHRDGCATGDAALWGAMRVLQTEHPEWRCGLIDLAADTGVVRASAAIAAICSGSTGEPSWLVTPASTRVLRLRHFTPPATAARPIVGDATYLVTGWTGGIGSYIARWLLERGARHLLLIARRPPSAALRAEMENCARLNDAAIECVELDITDLHTLRAAFARAADRGAPIRGIFHAAGQLSDGLLLKQGEHDFERSLAAKVTGTWNLHTASLAASLDAFVLFSSAVTLFAPPSQGAHAAACAAMDYIAAYRHALGLPALSIGWGAWSQVGKAATSSLQTQLAQLGILGLNPAVAVGALQRLLPHDAAHAFVIPTDWQRWQSMGGTQARSPLFDDVLPVPRPHQPQGTPGELPLNTALQSQEESVLQSRIVRTIAQTLMAPVAQIDVRRSVEENGLDSIMTVELRERLSRELGVSLPLVDFFRERSIAALAARTRAHLTRHAV
jgi:acyl transferase domain-containing protein/acyl carrier protein